MSRFLVVPVITVILTGMLSCGIPEEKFTALQTEMQALQADLTQKDQAIAKLKTENQKLTDELRVKPTVVEQVKTETAKAKFTVVGEILYGLGENSLNDAGKKEVDKILAVIKKDFPTRRLVIEGHADTTQFNDPTKRGNWEIAAQRAMAVMEYMAGKGIKREMMSVASYGDYAPAADNSTEQGRAKNRRAVIVVQPAEEDVAHDKAAAASAPTSPQPPQPPTKEPQKEAPKVPATAAPAKEPAKEPAKAPVKEAPAKSGT